MSTRHSLAENDSLIHDLAVAQASFLLASLAASVSASIDHSAPLKTQRDQYFTELAAVTCKVISVMADLAADAQAMEDIREMGLKIAEDRARTG